MKHFYRYETDSAERKDALCKFLRRSGIEFQSGFGQRKISKPLPRGVLYQKESSELYWVQIFCEDDQADEVNHWLSTH